MQLKTNKSPRQCNCNFQANHRNKFWHCLQMQFQETSDIIYYFQETVTGQIKIYTEKKWDHQLLAAELNFL